MSSSRTVAREPMCSTSMRPMVAIRPRSIGMRTVALSVAVSTATTGRPTTASA